MAKGQRSHQQDFVNVCTEIYVDCEVGAQAPGTIWELGGSLGLICTRRVPYLLFYSQALKGSFLLNIAGIST